MTTCSPASLAELTECLQQAYRDRLKLRVVGNLENRGHQVTAAEVPGVDVAISLGALGLPIEHVAGDLIATLPAGATLASANAHLQREGQWLPLDPPGASDLTIGALVAANASGPRRHRHGSPRDLIIGVDLALSDGRLVKAGGRVVKNVAGYDLARMMCGSLGSLAIVTSATFKLAPLPPASRTVVISVKDSRSLGDVVRLIVTAHCTPAAVELASPPYRLLVRFETTAAAAEEQARSIATLSASAGAACSILAGAEEQTLWDEYERRVWLSSGSLVRLSVLPSNVSPVVERISELCAADNIDYRIGGRAALGVLHLWLDGPDTSVQPAIKRIREFVHGGGGSTVVTGPLAESSRWDDMVNKSDSWPLMQAVKTRFDPYHLLNPEGGPGGL